MTFHWTFLIPWPNKGIALLHKLSIHDVKHCFLFQALMILCWWRRWLLCRFNFLDSLRIQHRYTVLSFKSISYGEFLISEPFLNKEPDLCRWLWNWIFLTRLAPNTQEICSKWGLLTVFAGINVVPKLCARLPTRCLAPCTSDVLNEIGHFLHHRLGEHLDKIYMKRRLNLADYL